MTKTININIRQTWGHFNFGIDYLKRNAIGIEKIGIELELKDFIQNWN